MADRESIRALLQEHGWFASEREIDHGVQFILTDGTRVNCFNTGRLNLQGRDTSMKREAATLLAGIRKTSSAPPASRTTPTTSTKDDQTTDGAIRIQQPGDESAVAARPLKQVTVYTDGACIGNPGPGGYGIVLLYDGHRRELSGGFRRTTNNRMELIAAIQALAALRVPCLVTLYSDSQYVVRAMTEGWATRWQSNGWRRNKREEAVNVDLWKKLLAQCDKHSVTFEWVRGHAGNRENEVCDRLAVAAAQMRDLPIDHGYEPA